MLRVILIAILLYYILKWIRRGLLMYKAQRQRAPQEGSASELVKCARCSTYVSKNEADFKNGEWICSDGCSDVKF